jgi:hypothetical protein
MVLLLFTRTLVTRVLVTRNLVKLDQGVPALVTASLTISESGVWYSLVTTPVRRSRRCTELAQVFFSQLTSPHLGPALR